MKGNRRITNRELSDDVQISYGSVLSVINEDLSMNGVSAKFVTKLFSADQKDTWVLVAQDLLVCVKKMKTF